MSKQFLPPEASIAPAFQVVDHPVGEWPGFTTSPHGFPPSRTGELSTFKLLCSGCLLEMFSFQNLWHHNDPEETDFSLINANSDTWT